MPSCGVPAEGDQHTLAERVRLALVLPGSSRRTFSFSVAGAAARPAGGRLPDSCLLAAPRVSQSPSLPSALLGVGTRLSPWSSCLSVSPHGHVLTSRAGRRSAPRLAPARPRTAPVLLGAAFPGLRHRHRPHVRASRFALAVFLIATEYRHVEAAAPQFGAFRQVSELETPVLPRGLYGEGGRGGLRVTVPVAFTLVRGVSPPVTPLGRAASPAARAAPAYFGVPRCAHCRVPRSLSSLTKAQCPCRIALNFSAPCTSRP